MLLILVVGVTIAVIQPVYQLKKLNCQQILKNGIGLASVYMYRSEHGYWPHQLNDLSNELINPLILVCPGSGHLPGSFTNADSCGQTIHTLTGRFILEQMPCRMIIL
jgi:hypothetical protein